MPEHVFHYEILERIGEGGMGVVYRARDTRLERDVALKFLSLDFTGSESLKERFIQEAQAASALDHQNICTIHAIEETEDGRLFIAMGYYQGETVKAKLSQGSLPWQEIVKLAFQIASGLQAAHERGIIHLDIKPANLMVTPDGQVKILDFGLSRYTSEIDRTRPQGPLMGTVAYMAPELVQGEETGPESDVWALGVVMYEMATGGRPFQGKNDMAVLYGIVHKDFTPPCEKAPDLPEEVGRMIRRALVKDRRHRYQSAAEILADLEPLNQQSSNTILLPPDWPRQKLLRRTLVATLLLLGVVIALLIGDGVPTAAPPPVTDVAIVGVENQAGPENPPEDQESDWVGIAFLEMIRLRLPENEGFRWIALDGGLAPPGNRSFDPKLGFDPTARQYFQDQSIEWTLKGSFQRVEDDAGRVTVEIALQDTGSGAIERFNETGLVSELPEMAARIADSFRPRLEGARAPLKPVDGVTEAPRDPEPLRLLGEAQQELRLREAKDAVDGLEKAITIERESPLLHLTLSEAYKQLYRDSEARRKAADAIERARRLPWRQQLYYGAWDLELEGDLHKAAAVCRALWSEKEVAGSAVDPLTLDRGVHLASLLGRARQSSASSAVVDQLRPLLGGDPRVALVEVESIRDERHQEEQAAAARAVALARERGAPLLEARGLLLEGQAWQRLGELDKAVEDLEAARDIYSRHGYKGGEAGVLMTLGNVQQNQQDLLGAKTSYENATRLYGEIGNHTLRARNLPNVALVLSTLGELGAAIKILNQAIPTLVEEKVHDALVTSLINLIDWQIDRGELTEAEKTADKTFEALEGWPNTSSRSLALTRHGRLRFQQGDLLEARQILDQALEIQETTKDELWSAYTRSLLAQVDYEQGHLDLALQNQRRALQAYGENSAIEALIGQVLMTMGELDRARERFDRALESQSTLPDPGPAAQTRLYQAQLLFAEDRIEDSVDLARSVLAEIQRSDFLLVRVTGHGIHGRSLLALGDLEGARQQLESSRTLLANVESPLYELPLEILEARLMAARGDLTGGRERLDGSLATAMTMDFGTLELEIRLAMAEITLGTGSGEAGRNQLRNLAREARQKGFGLIALLAERVADASS